MVRPEAGTVTEGMLGCWDCDVLLCCSGGSKSGPPQLGSPWLLCSPPAWMGPIPRLCPGCLEEQPLLWVGLRLLSPSYRQASWEFFCFINSIYLFRPKCLSHLAKEASDQQQLAKQTAVMTFLGVWEVPSRNTHQMFGELFRGRGNSGAVWGGSSVTWAHLHKHSL